MSDAPALVPLLAAIRDLVVWFEAVGIRGVVTGGVAASLLGRPRVTRDVDALVLARDEVWGHFLSAGARHGFYPRRPDALEFARLTRVLLVRHEPSGVDVDIVFAALPFEEEVVERAAWVDVGGVRVPLATAEDLIIMKAVAHRPRDLADIESLVDANPALDVVRVRRWVREFSAALGMRGIPREVGHMLTRARKRKASERKKKKGSRRKPRR